MIRSWVIQVLTMPLPLTRPTEERIRVAGTALYFQDFCVQGS